MVETVGRRLHEARVQRALSVEEVAHATKLRPDKIIALENDDYGRFPSNAYAKGFLQIYGRYLGVDVSEFANTLDNSNPISVRDYQYLTNGVVQREPERASASFSFSPKRQTPSILPLIAFLCLLVLGVFGFQIYVNWQRVTGEPSLGGRPRTNDDTPAMTALPPIASPPTGVEEPKPAAPVQPPAVETLDGKPVARAEAVAPAPTATPVSNEVLVEPLKTTWITVRRDDPHSAPVFEDFLYRDSKPLKLKGARFFIEARDPSAVLIRKNGAPIAYQAPGVEIR
jgi:cytoskeletal protein RodZ